MTTLLNSIQATMRRLVGVVKHPRREEVVFYGLVGALCLFLAIVALDAYTFYSTVSQERTKPAAARGRITVTTEEVEAVIGVLDERQKQFNEILAALGKK